MKLFPRLPHRLARELFDEQTRTPFDRIPTGCSHAFEIWPATGAERISQSELADLGSSIRAVARKHGYPTALKANDLAVFDRELARELWMTSGLRPAEAAFGGVWSFLALVLVPDVVWWRAVGSTNVERFVASDLTRHTLARLWWRALLFTKGLQDPEMGWSLWESSTIGEADLDQIQTRRAAYGGSPEAFRCLVDVYPRVGELADSCAIGRREFWRTAYLRSLLRLGAFTQFTGASEVELRKDLLAVASGVAEAAKATGTPAMAPTSNRDPVPVQELDFDTVPLDTIVVLLAQAVRANGGVTREGLSAAFSLTSGISVPPDRADILHGIAWQGEALKYLKHEERPQGIVWLTGTVLPADDRRWRGWSIESFRGHIAALDDDTQRDLPQLCEMLFAGRPGQTVKRVARAARRPM